MHKSEEEILAILQVYEKKLALSVDQDEDGSEIFGESAIDILSECHDGILKFLFTLISEMADGSIKMEDLSELSLVADIYQFSIALNEYRSQFPYILQFTETLDPGLCTWEPIFKGIRMYFDKKRITEITSRNQFLIAFRGYINAEKINNSYQPVMNEEFTELRRCIFAQFSEIEKISNLMDTNSRVNNIYRAPHFSFNGSTGGLENEIVEWIAQISNTNLLLDDDFYIVSELFLNAQ